MEKRMHRLSFSITPNQEGYIVACNEIPYLFTDAAKIEQVHQMINSLITEYIEYFPYDAIKHGIDRNITKQVMWKATPNSIALE